jgi:hypothetical protein
MVKKWNQLGIVFLIISLLAVSCTKQEETDPATVDTLEFVSLVSEKDTITVQDVTKITATVKGEGLAYKWSCDNELGIIEGSGPEILFTICHTGKFKVSCEVSDASMKKAVRDVYVTTIE